MATHIQNAKITSPYSQPYISYVVSYIASRNQNKVTYIFTIDTYVEKYSPFGTGFILDCTISVGGVSGTANLKTKNDIWNNNSGSTDKKFATDTITITCDSDKVENQAVTFEVARTDSVGGNSGKVSTSDYYVTSPELDISNCKAPTYITITPSVFDEEVTISWGGAEPGDHNDINQYRIRYGVSDTPLENNEYTYNELATTSDTSITIGMSDKVTDRQYVKFAVRTEGKAGDSYHSNFAYADVVQRKCRNTKIKKGNEWVNCETFVKQNGVWVESVVDILNN